MRVKNLRFFILGILSFICVISAGKAYASFPEYFAKYDGITEINAGHRSEKIASVSNPELEKQAQQLYEAGRWYEAIAILENLGSDYAAQGNDLSRSRVLRNLALIYQKTGDVSQGIQTITESLNLVEKLPSSQENRKLEAQILEVLGSLQLARGDTSQSLESWRDAEDIYEEFDDIFGQTRNQINQALAMRQLGLNRDARTKLEEASRFLKTQPDSAMKFQAMNNLGDVLQLLGNLADSRLVLEEGLAIAQNLSSPDAIATAFLSLGNTARLQKKSQQALDFYQEAADASNSLEIKIQAKLNLLSLLAAQQQWVWSLSLVREIRASLTQLPLSQTGINAKLNLAASMIRIIDSGEVAAINSEDIAELLANSIQQAEKLGNPRTLSYSWGNLGKLYEQNQQWEYAKEVTEKSLLIAQQINAPDLAYQWQWQLGRVLKKRGEKEKAIAAYTTATKTLKSIRSDLVAISSEVRFSFRESVEPVYRELVELLLSTNVNNGEITQSNLKQARQVIESLQLAELDNFFKDACLESKPVDIDEVDREAAILSTIILSDRLAVIASLPGKPHRYYSTNLPQKEIENVLDLMRQSLRPTSFEAEYLPTAQKIYSWLIQPIEAELSASNVKTLVFILDGKLRNIPMSILHDGDKFLIEKYSLALTPGLQLLDTKPLARKQLKILSAGLSEPRQGFAALPGVEQELKLIQDRVPAEIIMNEFFTNSNFQESLNSFPFPVVHLATHGEFSSQAEDTFILTWNDKINANELDNLLRNESTVRNPIELLVLSACQTALGDNRAALGLAGVAVRAGARSTVGSLWLVSDNATAKLMTRFYQELTNKEIRKADALRRAQMEVLQSEYFSHPYYWSAFILVGNWL